MSPIDALLSQVFETRTATSIDYVNSLCYEIRKSFGHMQEHANITVREPMLPSWINASFLFGPYERQVLTTVATMQSSVVIFRGGTGSGKSSLAMALQEMARQISIEATGFTKDQLKSFLAVVDMQGIETNLRGIEDPVEQIHQAQNLQRTLADWIFNQLATITNIDVLANAISEAIQRQSSVFDHVAHSRQLLVSHFEKMGDIKRMDNNTIVQTFKDALGSIPAPESRLYASLLPWVDLGRLLDSKGGHRLVLLLDNLDPLPAYLQEHLWQILNTFFASPHVQRSGFVIALFLRISTAYDPIGAFSYAEVYDHAAPDSSEIVFSRITRFFLEPDSFPAWRNLSGPDKSKCARSFAILWYSLADRDSYMSMVVNALSGTNVRNALSFAKTLFHHATTKESRLPPQLTVSHLVASINESLLWVQCNEFGRRAVAGLRDDTPPRLLASRIALAGSDGARSAGRYLGNKMIASAIQCFLGSGFLTLRMPAVSARLKTAASIHKGFSRTAAESVCPKLQESALGHELLELFLDYKRAIDELPPPEMFEGGISIRDLDAELVRAFSSAVEETFQRRCKSYLEGIKNCDDTELAEWKMEHFGRTFRDFPAFYLANRRLDPGRVRRRKPFGGVRCPIRLEGGAKAVHGFNIIPHIAIDSDDFLSIPALGMNAFTLNKKTLCPAPLWILAWLQEANTLNQRDVSSVVNFMQRHGFVQAEWEAAILELTTQDRRFVFSGADDEYVGAKRIMRDDRNRILSLSWAGRECYEKLYRMPCYLQWSLSNIAAVTQEVDRSDNKNVWLQRKNSVTYRIGSALVGLELLLEDERSRIQAIYEEKLRKMKGRGVEYSDEAICREMALSQLSVEWISLDIFFGSMDDFLLALQAHARNVRKNSPQDFDSTMKLMQQWINVGENAIRQHEIWFGKESKKWSDWQASIKDSKRIAQSV